LRDFKFGNRPRKNNNRAFVDGLVENKNFDNCPLVRNVLGVGAENLLFFEYNLRHQEKPEVGLRFRGFRGWGHKQRVDPTTLFV
jgi:hypothetical protein